MTRRDIHDDEYARIQREYPFSLTCPTCEGAGTYRLYNKDYPCNCEEQMELTKKYFRANVGRRFHSLHWDDYKSEDRAALVPVLQNYAENFNSKFRFGLGFTISGPLGTGKTLLLSCALKDIIKQGRDVYFVQFMELANLFGSSYREPEAKARLEDRLKRCELLGLDELKKGISDAHKRFVSDALEDVIRHRYNHSLPTCITTNLTAEEQLDDFPRVFSLLAPVNQWYSTTGDDYRMRELREILTELELNGEKLPVS